MRKFRRISVFCGANSGFDPVYTQHAEMLGDYFVKHNIGLVYGASHCGVMGAIANAVLKSGGEVIGVIPEFLKTQELAHENLTELIVVDTMHTRKTTMNDLCDGVIAIPGGFGTMDELFEMLTWLQLGIHEKPVALWNINGFYDHLIRMIEHMIREGFVRTADQELLIHSADLDELFQKMSTFVAPATGKWFDKA